MLITNPDQIPVTRREGFILLTVLWAVVLISAITVITTNTFKGEVKSVARTKIRSANQTLVDGFAMMALEQIGVTRKFVFNRFKLKSGLPFACRHKDRTLVVTATDSTGLFDLNTTPKPFLRPLLLAGGASPDEVDHMIAAIIDYTDPDNKTANGQDENTAYREHGFIHLPKNSPFENIGELDQVAGMTAKVFSNIEPYLTVNSLKPNINIQAASTMLVKRVKGQAYTAEQNAGAAIAFSKSSHENTKIFALKPGNRFFEIRVMVRHDSGESFVRHAIGELSPGSPAGFKIVGWRRTFPLPSERLISQNSGFENCL